MVENKKVCVIGLGYIGLPTATFIALSGNSVIGVDINKEIVGKINSGNVPFFEPDFEDLLRRAIDGGHLRAQTAAEQADVYIIAVPTPFKEGYAVDDSYILSAADGVTDQLRGGELVILESTSPPGMTRRMAEHILGRRPDLTREPGHATSVYFAHCPERVLPGKIVREMTANDRVIGGLNSEAAHLARDIYSRFCEGELLITDATTAEMAKLTENSFRDVNIAFANELSLIAADLGINVWELIELANHHPRVNILQPGPGVGGHCIAVDPWFIVSSVPERARLIRTAREVNDSKPGWVVDQIVSSAKGVDSTPQIALLGLSFKPDIDDLRESPALAIARSVAEKVPEARIHAVEPHISDIPPVLASLENVVLTDLETALSRANIVVLLVDHSQFLDITLGALEGKKVIDTRGKIAGICG
ncbi:UDP-N-acetyl-D-mannosamine dehydrogenase [Corynebacterium meridianum]|uniref:UDP-N-acetyl-D-mannosamine dehydrogenase n=1 Tax=Corynebacterium meridianum TaxID=2765363 RepID=A0A934M808_9CORY|nr:UDP-N-acetyl-D-mannosamine dehydrogenase [Corynebacterium meridianum]MBI8990139.1 UDP-N-acetyl-D-mannosamine dehydrogenase [Corynebacterium meridianum]